MGCVSPPLSLIQNRTGDFAVPFAHLFPQTFASRVANVIILGCKRYPLCGPKNHSFADMGPRVKKYGIRASALSGYQSDAGTVSRVEDIAQPHWSALLDRR